MRTDEGRRGLDPAQRLVFATVTDDDEGFAHELGRGPDPGNLIAAAEAERATPVLARRLRSLRSGGVEPGLPAEALAHLDRLAMVHEFRLRELDDRLAETLARFGQEGIRVVLLKGAAFTRGLGVAPTDRPMGDVDLLVAPEDAARAWELARESGWQRQADLPPLEAYEEHHHLPPMGDEAGLRLGLELHTELFQDENPFTLSGASLESGLRPVEGHPGVFIPSAPDLLLHAATHLVWSHVLRFGAWKTLRDVHLLLASGALDPEAVSGRAREGGAASCLFWTLELARAWGGVPVDERWFELLDPGLAPRQVARLRRHFALSLAREERPGTVALGRRFWEEAVDPEGQGHGAVRPWTGSERWIPEEGLPGGGGAEVPSSGRGPRLLRGWGAIRHLARVLTAR